MGCTETLPLPLLVNKKHLFLDSSPLCVPSTLRLPSKTWTQKWEWIFLLNVFFVFSSHFSVIIPCGRLSWLFVGFLTRQTCGIYCIKIVSLLPLPVYYQ